MEVELSVWEKISVGKVMMASEVVFQDVTLNFRWPLPCVAIESVFRQNSLVCSSLFLRSSD